MASRKPFASFLSSAVSRPVISSSAQSRYICRPCQQQQQHQARSLHQKVKPSAIPKPTPFVPDVPTFLTLIGRKLSTHASKFQTWEDLFRLSSPQLKELGIEPARTRRYLLRWREKFRKGEYGIGGDFRYVSEGTGELRVVEVPSNTLREFLAEQKAARSSLSSSSPSSLAAPPPPPSTFEDTKTSTSKSPGMQKIVVNVPQGATTYVLEPGQTTQDLKKPAFTKLRDGHVIAGHYVLPSKGSNGSVATVKVTEGMWEHRRGHKVHGGERRRAETLHKLRVAERKENER